MSGRAHLVAAWGRVVAYKEEGFMSEMWRGVEVTISGVDEVLAVVGIIGVGSVMDASDGKQKL